MVLRRLLSGWLIAVAAFARSMALALERVAAARPQPAAGPAPSPVMAALAERYPGAPDHWLALVAERTAQLAEAGAAPLSVSSQSSAWPESLPGAIAPLEPLTPTAPAEGNATRRAPPRPIVRAVDPVVAPKDEAVPSLAALRERPTEVWRRPSAAPPRRPRPVFAPLEPAPPRVRSTTEGNEPARARLRSPLTLEGSAPFDRIDAAPPPREPLARVEDRHHTIGREEPVEQGPAPSLRVSAPAFSATPEAVRRPETPARLADTSSGDLPIARAPASQVSDAAPVGGERSAFAPPVLEAQAPKSRATPSPSIERAVVQETRAPDRVPSSASPKTSAARRPQFQALKELGAKPRAKFFERPGIATRPTPDPGAARASDAGHDAHAGAPTSQAMRSELATTRPAPELWTDREDAPAVRDRTRAPPASPVQEPARVRTAPFPAADFANDEAPRPAFAIARPSSARTSVPRAARSSSDDRWPRFPPGVFAAPVVAAIPSPRLEQLAREQEEGRWSV